MGIILGEDRIKKIYLGTTPVKKVYIGTDLVYSSESQAMSTLNAYTMGSIKISEYERYNYYSTSYDISGQIVFNYAFQSYDFDSYNGVYDYENERFEYGSGTIPTNVNATNDYGLTALDYIKSKCKGFDDWLYYIPSSTVTSGYIWHSDLRFFEYTYTDYVYTTQYPVYYVGCKFSISSVPVSSLITVKMPLNSAVWFEIDTVNATMQMSGGSYSTKSVAPTNTVMFSGGGYFDSNDVPYTVSGLEIGFEPTILLKNNYD